MSVECFSHGIATKYCVSKCHLLNSTRITKYILSKSDWAKLQRVTPAIYRISKFNANGTHSSTAVLANEKLNALHASGSYETNFISQKILNFLYTFGYYRTIDLNSRSCADLDATIGQAAVVRTSTLGILVYINSLKLCLETSVDR